jgi:predicted DNA-binding protein with PD1-like motif
MKSKLLNESTEKTFAVILDAGDEAMATLLSFARTNKITAAHFTAIGGFSSAVLGY